MTPPQSDNVLLLVLLTPCRIPGFVWHVIKRAFHLASPQPCVAEAEMTFCLRNYWSILKQHSHQEQVQELILLR
jgi:hypothetical protein